MVELIEQIKNEAIEITEKINEVRKTKLWLKSSYEQLKQKENELKQAKDKNSKEYKEEEQRFKKSVKTFKNTYSLKVEEELSIIEEKINNKKEYFLEQLSARMDIVEPHEDTDEKDSEVFIQKCTLIEQIKTVIGQINENFNIDNIKKISNSKLEEIIDVDMYNSIAIREYEILKEKYKDNAELSERIQKEIEKLNKERNEKGTKEEGEGRPVLTYNKGSRDWIFKDENGLLSRRVDCYEEIEDGSGKYRSVLTTEDKIKTRNEIMKEYGLTEEQANDVDIEAFLLLKEIFKRNDLAQKYILAFKNDSYDKGFDMCYNEKYTKRKERIKIIKEDRKERDKIAKRHKKLGIAKIIGKSKIVNRVKITIGAFLLATGLITAGGKLAHNNGLNAGQSVPKIESDMKDKKIGVLEGNGILGGIKDTENGLKSIEIDKSNSKSYPVDKKMGVLEGIKDTENRLKQTQSDKNNNETSKNNFVVNPFIQGNDVEFYDFSEQNQELDKDEVENKINKNKDKKEQKVEKEHKENEETNKTNGKKGLKGKEQNAVNKLVIDEIITDMMKPYCKAKVGGKIYEEPTDAWKENIGQKTEGRIQVKPESSKDRVYAKAKVKYQSSDGKYICFELANYEKDIKEGNIRKVILDVKNALKEKGLDSNYILNEGTQKVYLLEAPGISQWMKAEDTTMYEFEIDRLGNRIEKTVDEKVNDEKAKDNKQNETEKTKFVNNPFIQETNVNLEDYIVIEETAKPQYENVDFVKEENAQVVAGSAITITMDNDEIDDIMEKYQKDIEEAKEAYQLRKQAIEEQIEIGLEIDSEEDNLEQYLKEVEKANERHNLMMEALQEQREVAEEIVNGAMKVMDETRENEENQEVEKTKKSETQKFREEVDAGDKVKKAIENVSKEYEEKENEESEEKIHKLRADEYEEQKPEEWKGTSR